MSKFPWIDAADAAGPLPDSTADLLSCMLIPDNDKKLITLPPETWKGIWRLMHLVKNLPAQERNFGRG